MKILISGKNGFIGRALSDRLSKDNVVVGIPTKTLLDREATARLIGDERPDVIYHLAAYGNHYDQTDNYRTIVDNTIGLLNLLEATKYGDLKDFVNFSSSSAFLETQTFYSTAKVIGEKLCNIYEARFQTNVRTIYPYSVFGPGEAPHRFIPTVIRHLISGEQMELAPHAYHDWIYIEDFIDALLNGHKFIGNSESIPNIDIVSHLEDISGKTLNYEIKKMRTYDSTEWKAPATLNKIKRTPLLESLKKTFDYYAK